MDYNAKLPMRTLFTTLGNFVAIFLFKSEKEYFYDTSQFISDRCIQICPGAVPQAHQARVGNEAQSQSVLLQSARNAIKLPGIILVEMYGSWFP